MARCGDAKMRHGRELEEGWSVPRRNVHVDDRIAPRSSLNEHRGHPQD